MNNFVAIDFETSYGHIPCSIGIAEFINGKLSNQYYSLIRPIDLKFNKINTAINGISLDDVIQEREFDLIWKDISHFITDRTLIAHNSSTDISILRKTLSHYNIVEPNFKSLCTLDISKRALNLNNYKLSTIAEHFNILLDNHHNALSDAIACGYIFLKTYNYEHDDYTNDHIPFNKISNTATTRKKTNKIEIKNAGLCFEVKETLNKPQSDKLNGKTFVISGVFEKYSRDELKNLIEENGGKILSGVSAKLDFLVAGDNMGPSKLEKATKLNIKLISEDELEKMME